MFKSEILNSSGPFLSDKILGLSNVTFMWAIGIAGVTQPAEIIILNHVFSCSFNKLMA